MHLTLTVTLALALTLTSYLVENAHELGEREPEATRGVRVHGGGGVRGGGTLLQHLRLGLGLGLGLVS